MSKLVGQKKTGVENRLFIKVDSWHIAFYEQLRAILPVTPFILLYRRPDEVARSQAKQPGMHAVPGVIEPELFSLKTKEPWLMGRDAYLAEVLESYLSAYLQIAKADKNTVLVNYNEGPMAILEKVAAITGSVFSDSGLEKMRARSQFHSKRPDKIFSKETGSPVSGFLDEAMNLYLALEKKRTAVLQ